jgi:RNA-binding protein
MTSPALTNRETRKLKAEAQKLGPVVRVGKGGLTEVVVADIEQAFRAQELIKIRFDHGRIERDALAGQVAKATGAAVIMQVGKVAVFYRPKPGESKVAHHSNPHQIAS